MRITMRAARPVTLHDRSCWRTDGNSPVRIAGDRMVVYFSDYEPIGHSLRRQGSRGFAFEEAARPIRLIDDPAPSVGKWIEAIWREPEGRLRGWYHAEEAAPCPERLFVPHIGEVMSLDDGVTWHWVGETLRAPPDRIDCSWQNGFVAAGYGDLSVVPDRAGSALYLFFSSYHIDESAQGVAVARLPTDRSALDALAWWGRHGWQPPGPQGPRPLWPVARGWRHAGPDGFWGPAVHYNRALDGYVMLLNHTAGGTGNLVQEGIYASFNRSPDDPAAWSRPIKVVSGGGWYPQVVGLEDGCGDAEAGVTGRFFMSGFSAWEIEFSGPEGRGLPNRPLCPSRSAFHRVFGPERRCPW